MQFTYGRLDSHGWRRGAADHYLPLQAGACLFFLDRSEVQGHGLSRWLSDVEIKVRLFVAFGVLLSPEDKQRRRKLRNDNLRPMDPRVTSRTESDHKMQHGPARFPMVDAGFGIPAHPTGISIAL